MSDELTIDRRRRRRRRAVVDQPRRGSTSGWALVLISVAQLMVVLDATIANIALPFIGKDLDITGTNLTWIVTGYALAFGGLLLLGGRLGDLYGRRRIFMIGLVVFAVASLLGGLAQTRRCCSAPGPPGLRRRARLPGRAGPDHHHVPGRPGPQPRVRRLRRHVRRRRGRRPDPRRLADRLDFDLFGTDIHGWRLTFLINVPIGIVAALLAPRFLHESESPPGPARRPRRHHRHRRPARARLRPHPRRQPGVRLGRPLDHHQPGRPARCCSRSSSSIESPGRAPAAAVPHLRQPHPRRELRGDDAAAGRDVLDVLLPEPVHPERHGLQPAQDRLRVPAVQRRHRRRARRSCPTWSTGSTPATSPASAR